MGDVRRFHQIGGHVALDFVNTLGGRPDEPDDEYLHSYADLVHWTQRGWTSVFGRRGPPVDHGRPLPDGRTDDAGTGPAPP